MSGVGGRGRHYFFGVDWVRFVRGENTNDSSCRGVSSGGGGYLFESHRQRLELAIEEFDRLIFLFLLQFVETDFRNSSSVAMDEDPACTCDEGVLPLGITCVRGETRGSLPPPPPLRTTNGSHTSTAPATTSCHRCSSPRLCVRSASPIAE